MLLIRSSFSLLSNFQFSYHAEKSIALNLPLNSPGNSGQFLAAMSSDLQRSKRYRSFLGSILLHEQPVWEEQQIHIWKNNFTAPLALE